MTRDEMTVDEKTLAEAGVPEVLLKLAGRLVLAAREAELAETEAMQRVRASVADPLGHSEDPHFGRLAQAISAQAKLSRQAAIVARETEAPWQQWGSDIDPKAVEQMRAAMRLPVAAAGALMPDAHVGYGLPIGGVLATENAVVPYAVGVDIACRMKLTVFDAPVAWLDKRSDILAKAIENETRFGMGAEFSLTQKGGKTPPREHAVLDDDWDVSPVTKANRDKAWRQLGTSGSGNHFVEFGSLEVSDAQAADLGLAGGGTYLALLSHSGSRGTGAAVCNHYSRLAMNKREGLPKELTHLAWLSLDEAEGQEYWQAMQLMGRYAAANHAVIHRHVAKALGLEVISTVENHHNFAWEEEHVIDGQPKRVIVHRKGATPAGAGVLGIIPGSMASPGYVVRGRGEPVSLLSASHGAGRRMSRTQARNTYRWAHVKRLLADRGVKLLSAGIDEVPYAYKDITEVMAAQSDLVEVLGAFQPRLVKMAPEGERPED
jgi:tRNA-splicing ligase RtcB